MSNDDLRSNAKDGIKKNKKRKQPELDAKNEEKVMNGAIDEITEEISTNPTKKAKKDNKLILFLGNLTYDTTKEQIEKHFQCAKEANNEHPVQVRLITSKETNRPKGFAFLEFETAAAARVALKLHHTMLNGRKINVEVTAGGGGKNEARIQKIKQKNKKLNKQRNVHFKNKVLKKTSKESNS